MGQVIYYRHCHYRITFLLAFHRNCCSDDSTTGLIHFLVNEQDPDISKLRILLKLTAYFFRVNNGQESSQMVIVCHMTENSIISALNEHPYLNQHAIYVLLSIQYNFTIYFRSQLKRHLGILSLTASNSALCTIRFFHGLSTIRRHWDSDPSGSLEWETS